ncbi:MAG: hypothetical protein IPJ51_06785 [Saprospiraceae bacterium]|nr:hypothetical protein [Saprospiraceae bacterium]
MASVYNYPPSNILNLNGRANIKFRPVFYCALDGETAFWESDPKIDDVIYLSSWSIESSFDIFSTFILPMSVNQDNKLLPLIRKHREWQIEQINNGSKHKLDELLFINDMVSEWLKNEIKPYPKSSWIAYNYLYAYYGISFLFYPSASTKSKSTCLAIHPNFVDNSMKLERIYIFTLSGNGFIPVSTIFKDGINLKIRDMNQAEKEEIKEILNRAVEIKK